MLRVLGRSLANLGLGGIRDKPTVRVESVQVFPSGDKLVTLAQMLGRRIGKEGGDGNLQVAVVGHHGVDSSDFLLRLKGKVRKLSGTKFGCGFDVSA